MPLIYQKNAELALRQPAQEHTISAPAFTGFKPRPRKPLPEKKVAPLKKSPLLKKDTPIAPPKKPDEPRQPNTEPIRRKLDQQKFDLERNRDKAEEQAGQYDPEDIRSKSLLRKRDNYNRNLKQVDRKLKDMRRFSFSNLLKEYARIIQEV